MPAFSRYAPPFAHHGPGSEGGSPCGTSCDVCGLAAPGVSAAGGGAGEDIRLEQLRRLYPRWSIWRGRTTGDYWAMPPRGHPTQYELITARDAEELAQRLAEAEEQHNP
jgi:hypothetical protein